MTARNKTREDPKRLSILEVGEKNLYSAGRLPLTSRFATVDEAPDFSSDRISEIRDNLGLSQPLFAAALNVSSETVKAWEQGKRVPDGAALRLLQLAEKRPEWILEAVRVNRRHSSNKDQGAEESSAS
jgi:DNA-binding transcriptional regulator YiaG